MGTLEKATLDWEICKQKVAELVTEDSIILDIGSKDGNKSKYIMRKGHTILCDVSKEKKTPVRYAKAKRSARERQA